jgi:hypothetical protein
MWMLSFIPANIIALAIHGLVIAGILLYLLGKFTPYKILTTPIAILIFCIGIFFEGNLFGTKEYLKQVKEWEDKIKIAEEKSAQVNTVIETKYIEKIKYIDRVKEGNVQIVEKIVTKYDNLCTLSNAAIVLHNSASQNVLAPSSGPSLEGTSNVKASELIGTVVENYGTYYKVKEQVEGWQQWYKEQKKVYESLK